MALQERILCIPNAQNIPKAVKQRLYVKVKTLSPLVPSAKNDEKKTENKKVAQTEIVVPAEEPAKK